jgi:uncharacterized protein (TIGR02996 family)
MNDRQALLAAVLEHPEDDTPRLVYADYLDETGRGADAARAVLIRAQCDTTHGDPPAPGVEDWGWVGRQQVIAAPYLSHWGDVWLGELGAPAREPAWIRGFVERATLSPTAYRGLGGQLHAATPLREVRFEGRGTVDLGRVARVPGFERLTGVQFGGYASVVGIDRLAVALDVRLRRLAFRCPVDALDVRRIGRSNWAPNLHVLGVGGSRLAPPAETAELVESLREPGFSGLRGLELTGVRLRSDAIASLGGGEWRELESLRLRLGELEADGVRGLVATPLFRRGLPALGLVGHRLTDADVADLVTAPGAERIVALDLSWNRLTAVGARHLLTAPRLGALRELDVRCNRIDLAALAALLDRFGQAVLWPQLPAA